jgi:thermitase
VYFGLSGISVAALSVASFAPVASAESAPRIEQTPQNVRAEVRDDQLLVKFRRGIPALERQKQLGRLSSREVGDMPALDVKVVDVGRGNAALRKRDLEGDPSIEYVEHVGIARATGVPTSEPLFRQQWALDNRSRDADIDARQAWNVTRGESAARIAILDSGVTMQHPDLQGSVVEWRNWTLEGLADSVVDEHGHGTHVAGIAAARANGTGIAGVCPDCSLVIGKVLGKSGAGDYTHIANGILWAAGCDIRHPVTDECAGPVRANVINLSLGGYYDSITLRSAVDKAWARGVVLACAAGNDGENWGFYPAAYPNCIAVGATDNTDARASFSNHGANWVDVAAPGANILSTVKTGGHAAWNGTSMAAPHVAGLAGLLASKGATTMPRAEIERLILTTTDPIRGSTPFIKGRINACRALASSGC